MQLDQESGIKYLKKLRFSDKFLASLFMVKNVLPVVDFPLVKNRISASTEHTLNRLCSYAPHQKPAYNC